MAAVLGTHQLLMTYGLDDPGAQITYRCLTLALAYFSYRPKRVLRTSGRPLVGLVMAFVTSCTRVSPLFLVGRIFHLTQLIDPRFEPMAK